MKRNIFLVVGLVLIIAFMTAAVTKQYSAVGPFKSVSFISVPLTADLTAEALPDTFVGGALYSVEVKCTDDNAIAYTLYSHLGTTLYTNTTSGAIAGQIDIVDDFFPVNGPMTLTTTGYGDSVGCTMEISLWAN